jgi:hypothetical protein
VYPFSAQQSFDCPTSLLGLQQQVGQKVSELCSYFPSAQGKKFPTVLSPRENAHGPDNPLLQMHMGLTTRFFNSNDLGLLVTNNSQIFPSTGMKMDGLESMDGKIQGENDHQNDE